MRNNLSAYQARLKKLEKSSIIFSLIHIRSSYPDIKQEVITRYQSRLERLTKRTLLSTADNEIRRETWSDIPKVRIAALAAKDALK